MRRVSLFLLCACGLMTVMADEQVYTWSEVFPNYKQQIPSSDFTTPDNLFRFTTEKANGVTGPQFGSENKAGLLLRLYADNTLRIESLTEVEITAITFVIGGNGHYKLTDLSPSNGAMQEPYLGKDETDTFKEYRLFWTGNTTDVTFTVGHECVYGVDCVDQHKEGEPGTCMTKQMIITTTGGGLGVEITNDQLPTTNKIIKDNQLFIIRGDKTYTVTGQETK